MADFLLAAWLSWITPLLAALSSCRPASRSSSRALSLSPASAASRNLRIAVFTDDLTDLLRSRAASLVRIRLICDLILATRGSPSVFGGMSHRAQWPCTAGFLHSGMPHG